MEDPRAEHIANLVCINLGAMSFVKSVAARQELMVFIEDPNVLLLHCVFVDNSVRLSITVGQQSNNGRNLYLLKKERISLATVDSIVSSVMVNSMIGASAESLYQGLYGLIIPTLARDAKERTDKRLQSSLRELENNLRSVVTSSKSGSIDEDISRIVTPNDEIQFWARLQKSDVDDDLIERAEAFSEAFEMIKTDFVAIAEKPFPDLIDMVERVQDTLDQLWKVTSVDPYPQKRMVHLMNVIGSTFSDYITLKLSGLGLLTAPMSQIREPLRYALQLCETWTSCTETLTTQYWPGLSGHKWSPPKFTDDLIKKLRDRVDEILLLRTSYEQLIGLLSAQEQEKFPMEKSFQAFQGISLLQTSAQSATSFQAARKEYEKSLSAIESVISTKLKAKIASISSQPLLVLRELQKYRDLIRRPNVSKEFASEREILLGQLHEDLRSRRSDFDTVCSEGLSRGGKKGKGETGKNLPPLIASVVWAKQQIVKIEESIRTGITVLGDLEKFKDLESSYRDFVQELKRFVDDQFKTWESDTVDEIRNPHQSISLEMNATLMQINKKDGNLVVNFSDRLVTLLREVRQFQALGYPIHPDIAKVAKSSEQFYRHGIILKSVANFYNSIEREIIPSQKTMLLDAAFAFEDLVRHPRTTRDKLGDRKSTITWGKPEEVEEYVNILQQAAERLTSENRKLKSHHSLMSQKTIQLMNTDLLRQGARWKEIMTDLRGTIDTLQSSYKEMTAWKTHWDYQLFKALEHQFAMGLERLNENLPEIHCQLVIQKQKLQFNPPMEELRSRFFREMKKFISFPMMFLGLGDTTIFRAIVNRNPESLFSVFKKAEDLFNRLYGLFDSLSEWDHLASMDNIDAMVEKNVQEAPQFEANFKMLKSKGRDLEKVPPSFKIDCFNVSTIPMKSSIEDIFQKINDALVANLKIVAQKDLTEVGDFITSSLQKLSQPPKTITEINEARDACLQISSAKIAIQDTYRRFELKNKLLKSVVGFGLDVSAIQAGWDKLEATLDGHEKLIAKQLDQIKAGMKERLKTYKAKVDKFVARWNEAKPKKATLSYAEAKSIVESLVATRKEVVDLNAELEMLQAECIHFQMLAPKFENLEQAAAELTKLEEDWNILYEMLAELDDLEKQEWLTFRLKIYVFEDFVSKWDAKMKTLPSDSGVAGMKKTLMTYQALPPCLKAMRGDQMEIEHWQQLFKLLGLKSVTRETLLLGHLLKVADTLVQRLQDIKDLVARAQGEVSIREALQELEKWSQECKFTLMERTEAAKPIMLIKEWKDVMTGIGDNQALVQSLKVSPYFPRFQADAITWESKLILLDEALLLLNQIQRKWVYLEPIFSRGALPSEQARFRRVDDDFRGIMGLLTKDSHVMTLTTVPDIIEKCKVMLDQLERCQKALANFLEEKRSRFPRFYFIGDDDLLEILGQSKDPQVIEAQMQKLYAGIRRVTFNPKKTSILEIKSSEGEIVPLSKEVKITGEVEGWLSSLTDEMKSTLRSMTVDCIKKPDPGLYPAQILSLAECLDFTKSCEEALTNMTLQSFMEVQKERLRELTEIYSGDDKVMFLKIQGLILDVIHNKDVVRQLQDGIVEGTNAWEWQKQLRFYLSENNLVSIRMSSGLFEYTYEYQGNALRLVHTPLTDKCYLTLTQGLSLGMGGNPYGPAGTGKTESVKALGLAFGRQVLVFNCDEGIDYKSMGRIFAGLVKSGAWGCFDEFNRLEEDVLSAVSTQIQIIQDALRKKSEKLDLLERVIEVDHNAAIFVTLNPAGKGYGGRSKLPDNLKQLFRPVAMSAPDINLIAETLLYAEGYVNAEECGRKIVSVFTLSKQLLSPQQHYDWGLRALKTVLRVSGQLLQEQRKLGTAIDGNIENQLVVKSLRVNTLSKLTFTDLHRFQALIQDIFPGTEVKDVDYATLTEKLKESLAEHKLQENPTQIQKMLQFYEATRQRMGVVITGPSGCGKTTIWQTLRSALSKTGQVVKLYQMNPKAMPRQQLLGHMNMDTREWHDGILTSASRKVVAEPPEVRSWILCDGDVDPEWVESLNSVLDDNKLLTMPNGERIQFGSNVNFIFETHSLSFASPATVSRMGMIFMSDEDVDIPGVIKTWMERLSEADRKVMEPWIKDHFVRLLDFTIELDQFVIETTKVGLVLNGLSQIASAKKLEEFAIGLIRGLGGNLTVEARLTLAKEVFDKLGVRPADLKNILDNYWAGKAMAVYAHDASAKPVASDVLAGHIVQTAEVQRISSVLEPWMKNMEPFIIVGPEGSGKRMHLRKCFASIPNMSVATVHCNAQTQAADVISKLMQMTSPISSNTGRVLRPKEGERLILYLKDLNLPKPDKYDTSQLISFLQQLITYKGFFDNNNEWVGISNIQIVGSMNPATTVGRHPLNTRFTSTVRLYYVHYPPTDQLGIIFAELARGLFSSSFQPPHKFSDPANVTKLAASMVEVYERTRTQFTLDMQPHYLFTPRDITQWLFGLLRYDFSSADFMEIWVYEAQRIFRDRLVGSSTQDKWDSIINPISKQFSSGVDLKEVYFSTFASAGVDGKLLKKVSAKDYLQLVATGLQSYEREVKELNIFLFPEILSHVSRVDRVLSTEGGSLLLAGRGGVGRRTAVMLTSFMSRMFYHSPNITRDYNIKSFYNDLKIVLAKAGIEGEHSIFYLEDHQIVKSTLLEIMNSILSAGEVPGLYSAEELDNLLLPLRDLLKDQGFRGTPFAFFVSRIKKYLHIVFGMDPTHPEFQVRTESNPALYTNCSLQWFDTWTDDGMKQVPRILLRNHLKEVKGDKKDHIARFVEIHKNCAEHGSTPRDYIAFLHTYVKIYEQRSGSTREQFKFLQSGLQKLKDAAVIVDELKKEAAKKKEELNKKQKAADQALVQIKKSMDGASKQRLQIEELKTKQGDEEKLLLVRQGKIEKELSSIEPILQAAKSAVGSISPKDIQEIRSLRAPPEVIKDILEGVMCLMGLQDTSWPTMKTFLLKLKDEILSFDMNNVNREYRIRTEKFLEKKKDSFDEKAAKRSSSAAAPLAEWVKATVQYASVLERIEPLRNELKQAKLSLEASQSKIKELEKQLAEVDDKVAKLQQDFGQRTAEAHALKASLADTESRMNKASDLLKKLDGEKSRWDVQAKQLNASLDNMPVYATLAAAFVTYLARFPEDMRAMMMARFKEICKLESFDFRGFTSTESETLIWKAEGLPADNLSVENAIVIRDSVRVPFIIDPTTQAAEWLQANLTAQKLSVEVTNPADPKFLNTLELAVRFGKTLIIREVDRVEPLLYPLIRKDFNQAGSRMVVQIGDKTIDFNEKFKLYLVTRNPNPSIPPDAAPIITEINFSVTRSGLEGQLLGLTIQSEKPQLEKTKSELLAKEEELKIQLSELEKSLLQELATSEGDILKNESLLQRLNETKEKSSTIGEALTNSKATQATLDQERETYRNFAKTSSELYLLIRDLKKVNHMYQFSLPSYLRLFKESLVLNEEHKKIEDRLNALTKKLRNIVFQYISRSIFKSDRAIFALHMIHCLFKESFQPNEWEFFTGQVVQGIDGAASVAIPSWTSPDRKPMIGLLASTFPALFSSMKFQDADLWGKWAKSPQCEIDFPTKVMRNTSPFQKVLIVQTFRPDRLESAMISFATFMLGLSSLSPTGFNLEHIATQEATHAEPILFIVSPGTDPTVELQELADKVLGSGRLKQVAMGQGQAVVALAAVREAAENGDWVCLKNMHLVTAWLPTLEKELNQLNPSPNFRIWLTTESHPKFSSIMLQSSLKITYEAPPGLKQNLLRTYEGLWNKELVTQGNSPFRAQALFVLAWLHALLQERRVYIPQGWVKFYEFSTADLRVAYDVIDTLFKLDKAPQWNRIIGTLENAIYGGRVDNKYDARVLRTYLDNFFHPETFDANMSKSRPLKLPAVLPTACSFEEYMGIIRKLSEADLPSSFGLPDNINRSVQVANSSLIIAQLKAMAVEADAIKSFDREKWAASLNPILQLWTKLGINLSKIKETKLNDKMSPVEAFVVLERNNCIKLCRLVNDHLAYLGNVINGLQLITPETQDVAATLISDRIPAKWEKYWEGPESPFAYLRLLARRMGALDTWQQKAASNTLLSGAINLADLFHPETFLNALRQQTARKAQLPMDNLHLISSWNESHLKQAHIRIQVEGLLMQGATLSSGTLADATVDTNSLVPTPNCYLAWIDQNAAKAYTISGTVAIPVYETATREKLVTEFHAPCGETTAKWILTGTALFVHDA